MSNSYSNLHIKILSDSKAAFINKDETALSTLRMLKAAIEKRQKEKFYQLSKSEQTLDKNKLEEKSRLTDEEILAVVSSELKKRNEAAGLFKQGNREDLANKEFKEAEILKKYLPEQLSDEKLTEIIKQTIKESGVLSAADFGKVMKAVMEKIKGKADGAKVSQLVKKLLGV